MPAHSPVAQVDRAEIDPAGPVGCGQRVGLDPVQFGPEPGRDRHADEPAGEVSRRPAGVGVARRDR